MEIEVPQPILPDDIPDLEPNAAGVPVPDDDSGELYFVACNSGRCGSLQDIYALLNKQTKDGKKGRELNPRFFNPEEWANFQIADHNYRQAHLDNEAVRIVYPDEARKVPKRLILPVPSRYVRVNKNADTSTSEELLLESR